MAARGIPMVGEQGSVDGHHLEVGTLGVHVGEALFRGVPDLGGVDQDSLAVADYELVVAVDFVAHSVPIFAGLEGLPQDLRGQVGVNVENFHG